VSSPPGPERDGGKPFTRRSGQPQVGQNLTRPKVRRRFSSCPSFLQTFNVPPLEKSAKAVRWLACVAYDRFELCDAGQM